MSGNPISVALNFGVKFSEGSEISNSKIFRMDEELIKMKKIANGDEKALIDLIAEWKGSIFAFFFRSLSNHADAEDLTQKLFHRVYRAAGTYKPKAKVSTWIFTIARNLLIDELKRRSRRPQESILIEWDVEHVSGSYDQELKEILAREMCKLPENQRTALLFRVQQEWSYREIADMMKTNQTNVKTWIFGPDPF